MTGAKGWPFTTYVVTDTTSVGAMEASARIAVRLAHTTAACSAIVPGTAPSGPIGTIPDVCNHRRDDSETIACA